MKNILVVFVFGALLVGCASSNIGKQYEFQQPKGEVASDIGFLVVNTDKVHMKEYSDDAGYDVFKGYTIYTPDGKLVVDVAKSYQSPEQIKLKQGEYIVIAEMHKNVVQSFGVKIVSGKILEVNKDMVENLFPKMSSLD